jgi:hypothetical protein
MLTEEGSEEIKVQGDRGARTSLVEFQREVHELSLFSFFQRTEVAR